MVSSPKSREFVPYEDAAKSEEKTVKSVKRRCLLVVLYLLMNCTYIMIGGTVMYFLEHDTEVDHLKEMQEYVKTVGLSQNQSDTLEDLGVCTFPNHLAPHWTFTGSCFYAFTVITTIGYGSFAPYTNVGRSFTAAYSIPGIAVVAVVLTNIASLIAETTEAILDRNRSNQEVYQPVPFLAELDPGGTGTIPVDAFPQIITSMIQDTPDALLMQTILRILQKQNNGVPGRGDEDVLTYDMAMRGVALWFQMSAEVPPPRKTTLKYLIVTWFGVGLWIVLWALLFSGIESWTVVEGMWFSFVSLSTIGFGDYVPNTTVGRICGFLFMAPGLGLMGAFFSVLSNMFTRGRFVLSTRMHVSDKMFEAQGFGSFVQADSFLKQRPTALSAWEKEDLTTHAPLPVSSPDSNSGRGGGGGGSMLLPLAPKASSGSLASAGARRSKRPPLPLGSDAMKPYSPVSADPWGSTNSPAVRGGDWAFPSALADPLIPAGGVAESEDLDETLRRAAVARKASNPLLNSTRETSYDDEDDGGANGGGRRFVSRKASHASLKNASACPNGHTLWVFAKIPYGEQGVCGRCGAAVLADNSVIRKCGVCTHKLCSDCSGTTAAVRASPTQELMHLEGSYGRSAQFHGRATPPLPVRRTSSNREPPPAGAGGGHALPLGRRDTKERLNGDSLGKSSRLRHLSPPTSALEPADPGRDSAAVVQEMADIVASISESPAGTPRGRAKKEHGALDRWVG